MTSPSFDILCGNGISAAGACLSSPFLHHWVFFVCSGTLCVWQSQPTTANSESVRKRVQFPPRNNQDNFCPAVLLVGVQITCCKSFLAGFTSAACPSPPPLVAGSALYFPRDPVLGFNSDQTRLTSTHTGRPTPVGCTTFPAPLPRWAAGPGGVLLSAEFLSHDPALSPFSSHH